MRGDRDLDQCITRRTVADAGHPLPLQSDHLPIIDADRDPHVQGPPVGQSDAAHRAVDRVEEVERELVVGILPAHRESPPTRRAGATAEGLAKDALQILGIETSIRTILLSAGRVTEVTVERPLWWHFVAGGIDLATVVAGALVLVAQQVIGDADFFEAL